MYRKFPDTIVSPKLKDYFLKYLYASTLRVYVCIRIIFAILKTFFLQIGIIYLFYNLKKRMIS